MCPGRRKLRNKRSVLTLFLPTDLLTIALSRSSSAESQGVTEVGAHSGQLRAQSETGRVESQSGGPMRILHVNLSQCCHVFVKSKRNWPRFKYNKGKPLLI